MLEGNSERFTERKALFPGKACYPLSPPADPSAKYQKVNNFPHSTFDQLYFSFYLGLWSSKFSELRKTCHSSPMKRLEGTLSHLGKFRKSHSRKSSTSSLPRLKTFFKKHLRLTQIRGWRLAMPWNIHSSIKFGTSMSKISLKESQWPPKSKTWHYNRSEKESSRKNSTTRRNESNNADDNSWSINRLSYIIILSILLNVYPVI